jgi:hypothetical protein
MSCPGNAPTRFLSGSSKLPNNLHVIETKKTGEEILARRPYPRPAPITQRREGSRAARQVPHHKSDASVFFSVLNITKAQYLIFRICLCSFNKPKFLRHIRRIPGTTPGAIWRRGARVLSNASSIANYPSARKANRISMLSTAKSVRGRRYI